jgi:hypothetical protein
VKIVKVYGGLGNQMFQYAFAQSLAARLGEKVLIDSSGLDGDEIHNGFELERVFGVRPSEADARDVDRLSSRPKGLAGRLRRKYFTKPSHVIDRKYRYQPELLDLAGDRYFEGYWQSEKYFSGIEDRVRSDFRFAADLDDRSASALRSLPRPIVSIHVRRGDFLKYRNLDICTPRYYAGAMESLRSRDEAGSFLVFSDDPEYCRRVLDSGGAPAVYVDWNTGSDSWRDMAMMSSCDHHVIANSSFSWWGAWLGSGEGRRVIAPSVWNRREIKDTDRYYSFSFEDVVPASWERMPI